MRYPFPVLAFLTGVGIAACTAEPIPSSATPSAAVPSTIVSVNTQETMSSTEARPAQQSPIPLLDQEAPEKFETATFALG